MDDRHIEKKRICLRCGKRFASEWCGNRRCVRCEKFVRDGMLHAGCRIVVDPETQSRTAARAT